MDSPIDLRNASGTTPLGTDILAGAEAIAVELGYLAEGMSPDERRKACRRVYYLAEKGSWPIWHEPGIGLMSTKSALRKYLIERVRAAVGDQTAVALPAAERG